MKREAAACRKVAQECSKVIAKVTHPIYMLETLLKQKHVSEVAKFACANCKADLQALTSMRSEAEKRIKEQSPEDLTWTMGEVNGSVKTAIANANILQGMLQVARSHFDSKSK